MATPATMSRMGIPASIMASAPPQTVAMEDEPLDSRTSETIRIVYGKSSAGGTVPASARSASIPWPISLRAGPLIGLTSPTLKGVKL